MSTIWLLRIGLFQNRIQVTGPSCRKGRFEDKVEFREAFLRQIKVFSVKLWKKPFPLRNLNWPLVSRLLMGSWVNSICNNFPTLMLLMLVCWAAFYRSCTEISRNIAQPWENQNWLLNNDNVGSAVEVAAVIALRETCTTINCHCNNLAAGKWSFSSDSCTVFENGDQERIQDTGSVMKIISENTVWTSNVLQNMDNKRLEIVRGEVSWSVSQF